MTPCFVRAGQVIGLGTGSTAAYAVDRIADLIDAGELQDILAVPTSQATTEQAVARGIPLSTLDDTPRLDITIDGADEVDPELNVVKGRGGALLREKMAERATCTFVCVVDDSKLVEGLGGSRLAVPVEVVQFCWRYNLGRLKDLPEVAGCEAKLRLRDSGEPFVTDNGNYIVDLFFPGPMRDPKAAADAISALEGVVEHGLFLGMVDICIVATEEGIEIKERPASLSS